MTIVQFYHLTVSPVEKALPKLLEKIIAGGFRVSLVTDSDAQAERLDQLLWTYDPGSFLAHGSAKDGNPEGQPIWITTQIETPNNANVLCITNGVSVENTAGFERIVDMFDGRDNAAVDAARARWTQYKNAGHSVSYLRQGETGGWEQKAVA